MRIISGICRGRRLTALTGRDIRPTPDRVREALFSSLTSRFGNFAGMRILDLYSGSGAMALEALSRGAERATLVDQGQQSSTVIRKNIRICQFEDRARFVHANVLKALPTLTGEGPFHIIFMDPPYGKGLIPGTLEMISRLSLLSADGILCAESARNDIVPDKVDGLELLDRRNYGSATVSLFTLHSAESYVE